VEGREEGPPDEAPFNPDARHRLARVRSLLTAGVDVRAAVATELVRSIRAKALDGATAEALFECARQIDPSDEELTMIQRTWEEGRIDDVLDGLRDYLHRITVDEVPIAERRLRRSDTERST
jgi:hypothetical protein